MQRAPSRLWRSMSQRWEKSTALTERAYRGSKPERLFLETLWKCQVYQWARVSDSIINKEQSHNALTHKNSAMVWKWKMQSKQHLQANCYTVQPQWCQVIRHVCGGDRTICDLCPWESASALLRQLRGVCVWQWEEEYRVMGSEKAERTHESMSKEKAYI